MVSRVSPGTKFWMVLIPALTLLQIISIWQSQLSVSSMWTPRHLCALVLGVGWIFTTKGCSLTLLFRLWEEPINKSFDLGGCIWGLFLMTHFRTWGRSELSFTISLFASRLILDCQANRKRIIEAKVALGSLGDSASDYFLRCSLLIMHCGSVLIEWCSLFVRYDFKNSWSPYQWYQMFIHLGYQDVVINGIQRALNIQEYDTIQFTISIFSNHHYTFG